MIESPVMSVKESERSQKKCLFTTFYLQEEQVQRLNGWLILPIPPGKVGFNRIINFSVVNNSNMP